MLPDNWNSSNYSLSNTNKHNARFSSNNISQNDWTSEFEANGAVFLPAAGWRFGTKAGAGYYGQYWSARHRGRYGAYGVRFYDYSLNARYWYGRLEGWSVRLVCDAE